MGAGQGPHRKDRNEEGLTELEARFVAELMVDLRQGAAYERADGSGEEKNYRQLAYQMAQRPHVKEAIKKALDERARRLKVAADRTIQRIERIAEKAEVFEDWQAALKGNELLGKHLKLFTEKHEHTGPNGGPIEHTHGLSDATRDLLDELSGVRAPGGAAPPVPD